MNEFLFFGLGRPGNNTVMEESPLFEPHYRQQWAQLDLDKANALLDEVGLTARDADGWRLGPDGVPLEIVAETAGEQPEQVDALELIQSDWAKLGIKMAIRPSHRDTLRGRALSGESVLSVWPGLTNGLVTADMVDDPQLKAMLVEFDAMPEVQGPDGGLVSLATPGGRALVKAGWFKRVWAGKGLWPDDAEPARVLRQRFSDFFASQYMDIAASVQESDNAE